MLKRALRHPAAEAVVAAALGLYLRSALARTRWTLVGESDAAPFLAPGRPAVFAFWHECLPLMPALWRIARGRPEGRGLRARALVSRHADGRLLGEVMRRFGVEVAHGSSSRGGAAGLRGLLDGLEGGAHALITPDGPRGPARRAAPGVAHLAAMAGVPVLPCAAWTSRCRRLGSWDRLVVPLPFGAGRIVCLPPIAVARDNPEAALPAIEAALSRAAAIAEGTASV